MSDALIPYGDILSMADVVVKSRMFPGITTPEAAVTLFLLCQSEGLHPMQAMMRYHVIQGRPAMKADAMLAEFMRRGGIVDWTEYTDEKVTAVFTSKGCPAGVSVTWTLADAKRAGITGNPTWTKYPRQMLKARVASDGVRMADPAVNQGRWTPEEHESFGDGQEVKPAEIEAPGPPQEPTGPSTLERQLAKSLGESPEPTSETVAPGHCVLKGCGGEVELYTSNSKAFPGREYWMCATAHALKEKMLNEGATNREANGAVANHYREWCGPWDRVDQAVAQAKADGIDATRLTRANRPNILIERGDTTTVVTAASIFDPEAISKQVAAKIAAESK